MSSPHPKEEDAALSVEREKFLSTLSPEDMLEELLAVIHGDGGHYSDAHGLAKAVADAEIKWYAASSLEVPVAQVEARLLKRLLRSLVGSSMIFQDDPRGMKGAEYVSAHQAAVQATCNDCPCGGTGTVVSFGGGQQRPCQCIASGAAATDGTTNKEIQS